MKNIPLRFMHRLLFILVGVAAIIVGIALIISKDHTEKTDKYQKVNCVYEVYDLIHKEKREMIIHSSPLLYCTSNLSKGNQIYYKVVNIEPPTPEITDLDRRLKEIDDESRTLQRKSRNP